MTEPMDHPGADVMPRCQHDEMGAGFRCTSCGKELVLSRLIKTVSGPWR